MTPILLLTLALLHLPEAGSQPYVVIVRGSGDACFAEVAGQKLTMDQLRTVAKPEARKGRKARIVSALKNTPYRCLGGVIYTLQTAGFEQVDFDQRDKRPE
ncbi:hypothetical protein [uncultured Sphingomonas sp.]|uniref:hypothetical protein n=1 Tax=uncultured Sphingomonas sp. TaxID=158754 RepID=UPI0025DAA03B|nr:hypothetical protein [uncultured Sphingomonas sp.]